MAAPTPLSSGHGLRWRLSVLWFLQFAIWGSWFPYVASYLDHLGIKPEQRGLLFASMGVGLWLAPLLAGQVADRWLATQHALAISHFLGGVLLLLLASVQSFWGLLILAPLYATAYVPTWALASSLSFRHLPDPGRQFGGVRLWATVGWVASGWLFGLWLQTGRGEEDIAVHRWLMPFINLAGLLRLPQPQDADCFRLAAVWSFALAGFCLLLPNTPPGAQPRHGLALVGVLTLLRRPRFAFFVSACFVLAVALAFYFLLTAPFLESLNIPKQWISPVQTIGQISEIPALLLLPLALRWLGVKATFALGIAAWVLRFLIFSLGGPVWLVIGSIGLHGLCHVFVLIVAQLYVDSQCGHDVRASAQNFLAVLAFGVALPLGFALGGWMSGRLTEGHVTDYGRLFLIPAAVLAAVLVAFWLGFDESANQRVNEPTN